MRDSLIPCFSSRSGYFSHNSLNELNSFDSKLKFSSKEKNLVASEEVLTTGSSSCPLMETVVYPDKYYDIIASYKTRYIRVRVQLVGAIKKL